MKNTFKLLILFSASLCFSQQIDLTNFTAEQYQTGSGGLPQRAIDGNTDGLWQNGSVTHTQNDLISWWRVDLQATYDFTRIDVWNRTGCCSDRLNGVKIYVGNTESTNPADYTLVGTLSGSATVQQSNTSASGRYIFIHKDNTGQSTYDVLSLAEVQAFGTLSGGGGTGGTVVWTANGNTIHYNSGNVGVGTTTPLEKLHLQSGKFLIKSNQNTNNSTHNSGLRFTTDVNSRAAEILIRRGSTSQKTGMQFNTYNGGTVETMTLLNGNVGIGTTNPDAPLTVNGRIHAKEVKVDLSVPGPDYVFKEDYKLRTLEEIRNYIAKHGHLPNIPTAKEMEDKGVDLGTMNMKLLEKIEELTLYILEQDKTLKAQKERQDIQDKKQAELEQRVQALED